MLYGFGIRFSKLVTQRCRGDEYKFYRNEQYSFLKDVTNFNSIFFIYVWVSKIDDFTVVLSSVFLPTGTNFFKLNFF